VVRTFPDLALDLWHTFSPVFVIIVPRLCMLHYNFFSAYYPVISLRLSMVSVESGNLK
jgi:hypothetical protein